MTVDLYRWACVNVRNKASADEPERWRPCNRDWIAPYDADPKCPEPGCDGVGQRIIKIESE